MKPLVTLGELCPLFWIKKLWECYYSKPGALGKWGSWNRAGQTRPRRDQRAGSSRTSSTKTPALGLQDRESFKPSKTEEHCAECDTPAPGYLLGAENFGL